MKEEILFKKDKYFENVLNYYKVNTPVLLGLGALALFISYFSGKTYINSIITLCISTFVTWLGHFLMHNYNTYNPIAWLHAITHHSPFGKTFLGKLIEYVFIEFLFFGGGLMLAVVILIHRLYGFYILNPYVILFWSVSVPFIHEVHYHILAMSPFHKIHHEDVQLHFSPDYWDVVLNRKKDGTPIENELLMLPELIFVALLVVCIIDTKYDFVRLLAVAPSLIPEGSSSTTSSSTTSSALDSTSISLNISVDPLSEQK
jgi:hypothetical protein